MNVSGFLRQHEDLILHSWEQRVLGEQHEVALAGLVLRDAIPALLTELATWLASDAPPEGSLLAEGAVAHVMQRLDAGLSLRQVLREYRLLRETILAAVLGAEATEQTRAGDSGDAARTARIVELARLNVGLDVVLSHSIERFVDERDRRSEEERARAATALRANDELTSFQLRLSDAIRPLSDAAEIQATVTRTARDFFRADRCYYCELEGDSAFIRRDASREGLPSVVGTYRFADFPLFRAIVEAGRPVVVDDVHTSEKLDEALRSLCLQLQIVSFLDVPVIREGKAVGILCVTQAEPRSWTDQEIRVAEQMAERTWTALDRARAEVALREANERLVEADRRKNDFLAVLSHELRNPLSPIRNGVYILERATPGGPEAIRARQVIDRQAQHLARLVDDLLDVTRIARGKVVLQKERVDVSAIARRTAEDLRETFVRNGVVLQIVDAGEPLWIEGDRTRLAQVIGNLLTNSAKFTRAGGRTVLAIEASATHAILRVRDDGVGISRATLEHVFEPFVQAAQSIARTAGGLGLGLALVKGLVELHGGTVTARSEGEDRGAEFVVCLPLETGLVRTSEVGSAPRPESKGRRVLVVEDHADTADSLRMVLTLLGHTVIVAHSGPEGLAQALTARADVILCDIGLPGFDGYEVARRIRSDADERLRRTFLVALTGYALPADIERAMVAGFDLHLAKPPNIEALAKLLEAPR